MARISVFLIISFDINLNAIHILVYSGWATVRILAKHIMGWQSLAKDTVFFQMLIIWILHFEIANEQLNLWLWIAIETSIPLSFAFNFCYFPFHFGMRVHFITVICFFVFLLHSSTIEVNCICSFNNFSTGIICFSGS